MKIFTMSFFMIFTISFSVNATVAIEEIEKVVVKDIEQFSSRYQNREIKIIESSMRLSFNPLQWLLMVKDLAAGEKRKVMTFRYRVDNDSEIKRGFLVMTYEKVEDSFDPEDDCFQVYINKLQFDSPIVDIFAVLPGFKTIRTIDHCVSESI